MAKIRIKKNKDYTEYFYGARLFYSAKGKTALAVTAAMENLNEISGMEIKDKR